MLLPPRFPAAPKLLTLGLLIAAYSALVAFLEDYYQPRVLTEWDLGLSVINGLILGSLVTFRTNEAKRRYWEARTLWGQLVNECRNMLVKAHALDSLTDKDRADWSRLLVGFAHALRLHLRDGRRLQDVPGFEQEQSAPLHVPLHIAALVQEEMAKWERQGKLDDIERWMFDRHARELLNICGGCERIRNTPVPLTYRALVHRGITLIMVVMPVLMAQDLGYWSAPIMGTVAYFIFGVELAAGDIEEPFGYDPDDLPLERFCETIQRAAEQELPRQTPSPSERA
jgi:putative membrane protein